MPDGQELWTTAQCAEHCGVKPATWRDYVNRLGAPGPVVREAGRGQNLYLASAVRRWHAGRRGPGWWGPRITEPSTKDKT